MYRRLIRPALFRLPAEWSHAVTLRSLEGLGRAPALARRLSRPGAALPVTLFGQTFVNPLGLAAGLDKDGRALDAWAAFGFGFIEIGTVTPRAQRGNPRPRLFRLPAAEALINRMGFNNAGVDALVTRLARHVRTVPIGVSIGKNRDTPPARTIDDYRLAFAAVAPYADYVAVNISSPNTPGVRDLQTPQQAGALLCALREDQTAMRQRTGRHVPLAVKIAPDFGIEALDALMAVLTQSGCEAVIATNTTVQRPVMDRACPMTEHGGLSGVPLYPLTRTIIMRLYKGLPATLPIIGVGGINDAESAWGHLVAGARVVQIYSGLIYQGPRLIGDIVAGVRARMAAWGTDDLEEALRAARGNLLSEKETKPVKIL